MSTAQTPPRSPLATQVTQRLPCRSKTMRGKRGLTPCALESNDTTAPASQASLRPPFSDLWRKICARCYSDRKALHSLTVRLSLRGEYWLSSEVRRALFLPSKDSRHPMPLDKAVHWMRRSFSIPDSWAPALPNTLPITIALYPIRCRFARFSRPRHFTACSNLTRPYSRFANSWAMSWVPESLGWKPSGM